MRETSVERVNEVNDEAKVWDIKRMNHRREIWKKKGEKMGKKQTRW